MTLFYFRNFFYIFCINFGFALVDVTQHPFGYFLFHERGARKHRILTLFLDHQVHVSEETPHFHRCAQNNL